MWVKLDEDLSPLVAEPLLEHGHEVRSVAGQGWSGIADAVLWPLICQEAALFITADKGFGDIRLYPPGAHPGIVLLRPDRESLFEYQALLRNLLARRRLKELAGGLTVVTPRSIRIRRSRR